MEEFITKWVTDPIVEKLIITIIGIIVINIIFRFLKRYLGRQIKDTNSRYRIRKFISFIGYLIVILLVLTTFRAHLKDLHIAVGIAGAGIAFSLQEVIVSLAGWLAISFGNFYKTGDRVQLGGIKGDVIDIAMLRTTLMEIGDWIGGDQYNGRIVRIANSFVFKEPVFNYSTDFPFLWDEITVPVKHGSDFRLAKDIFQRILIEITGDFTNNAQNAWKEMVSKYLIEAESVEPAIIMIINDNWLAFTLRYVVDFKKRRFIKDKIFTRILEEFEKADGRVSIASTTFQLTDAPVFNVSISKETK
jgi:small-conductance mechanosensitive channel